MILRIGDAGKLVRFGKILGGAMGCQVSESFEAILVVMAHIELRLGFRTA